MSARARATIAAASLAALGACAPPTQAAHPLISDDTATQGPGRWQLEASIDRARAPEAEGTAREHEFDLTLTRGLGDAFDLALRLPWLRREATGAPVQRGSGDLALFAKWRLLETDAGFSLALRPELTLASGDRDKGLGNGRPTAALTLVPQLQDGAWTWLANAGLVCNDNDVGARKRLWAVSSALLFTPADAWSLAFEVGASRAAEPGTPNRKFGLLGIVWHPDRDLDLDIGWRRSLGGSPTARTWGAGVALRW